MESERGPKRLPRDFILQYQNIYAIETKFYWKLKPVDAWIGMDLMGREYAMYEWS